MRLFELGLADGASAPIRSVGERAGELARRMIARDPRGARDLVAASHARLRSMEIVVTSLFEPAARALGNLWLIDACQGFELTLGLSRLQALLHELQRRVERRTAAVPRNVLIACQPGETHTLCAALHAALLWQAGCEVRIEQPANDAELERVLADDGFDALDLCLSAALRRDDWLPRMTRTIAGARRASANPHLAVMVCGRQFFDNPRAYELVGADAGCRTATDVLWLTDAVALAAAPPATPR